MACRDCLRAIEEKKSSKLEISQFKVLINVTSWGNFGTNIRKGPKISKKGQKRQKIPIKT